MKGDAGRKMKGQKLHLEAVDGRTLDLMRLMASSGDFRKYYLTGGTGLALQLGHRLSLDLDFFSEEVFQPDSLVASLRGLGALCVDQQEPDTLVGSVDGVRVSFFHYPYPVLGHTLPLRPRRGKAALVVAGALDIACMKLVAVGGRGARRDFVDIYFVLRDVVDLDELLSLVKKKYVGMEYNVEHLLKSLIYFEDAEEEPLPRMLVEFSWDGAKELLRAAVRQRLERALEG